MPTETMTPKERWLAVVNREKPDRIPMYYRATGEATAKLLKYMGCQNANEMFKQLHIDSGAGTGPRYVGPSIPAGKDMYGCHYENIHYEGGVYSECVGHPLAHYETVEEIERNYTWPSVDWFDYSDISKQIEGVEDRVISGGGSEPFLTYKHLRGEEQAYMDLILYPDIVHYCMEKLYGFCYENTRRIYEQIPGKVMVTSVAEDMGSQEGLLYSRQHLHRFFFPYMKRMIDLAHEAGAFVNTHSDGAIRDIIPDLIEMSVDIINPVQWRCKGMEREALKRDFGDKLIFEGAMDNQYTLPFGTIEEVRQEVRDNIRILGAGGGYILCPCHNIQVVGPPENVVAMYKTGYEEGWM
ncbi:uroporphyrinogen-III decarboxylase-like protein [Candidatus Poribacteria bacterium]|nr:uroporphyrinogen-III decarboxylase-like protein [Candidatus Poribacteria bacterium]